MFKSRKLRKEIREIEEGLKAVVIPSKKSETKKMKSIKRLEIKSNDGKLVLKEIKPPYPKCPSCGAYLEDEGIYNKKGKQKYDIDWTEGHTVKWECGNCGAEYESEKEDDDEHLLNFTKEEPKEKIIYPKKKKIKKKKTKR